jgi:hypothetical protein
MLRDEPLPSPWLDHTVHALIAEYTQRRERETYALDDSWRAVEIPKGFVQVL